MQGLAHLIGLEKIGAVVDDFYDRVQRHPTLARPFSVVHDWPAHKALLTHFWWTTLGGPAYREQVNRMGEKHAAAGFTSELLADWLALFRETLGAHLTADLAEAWHARAAHIGRSLELMHEFRSGRLP
jgi:hemoglobin